MKAVEMQLELFTQRWRWGRHSWRRRSEGGFDSSRYDVRRIDEATAKAYVIAHHYSASYPAARFRYGLIDRETEMLVGAVVLSVPVQATVLTGVFPGLEPYVEALELGRLVLDQEVRANAETWMMSRVFEESAHAGIRGIVSFSDPVPRRRADGSIVFPGHLGIVYQAKGAIYTGRSTARSLIVLPDGSVFNERAASKVRAQERGHEHVERKLVDLGASPMTAGMVPSRWLAQALDAVGARRVTHSGCHRYAWRLGRDRRERSRVQIALPSQPYPKPVEAWA